MEHIKAIFHPDSEGEQMIRVGQGFDVHKFVTGRPV